MVCALYTFTMEPNILEKAKENNSEVLERMPAIIVTCQVKDSFGQLLETVSGVKINNLTVDKLFTTPYNMLERYTIDGEMTIDGGDSFMFEVDGISFSKIVSLVKRFVELQFDEAKQKALYDEAIRKVASVGSLYRNNPNRNEKEMTAALMNEQILSSSFLLAQAMRKDCEQKLTQYKV